MGSKFYGLIQILQSQRCAGIPPSGFPQRGLRLDYGEGLVRDPELAAVLSGLLEPLTENRMGSREALGLLDGKLKADR